MTHVRLPLSALILLLVLCFGPAYAQQNNSTAETGHDAELREKAFKLLESLATQLSTLQSSENRARIGSNIAGSIWTRDDKRARALFQQVAGDINLGLQNLDIKDPEDAQTLLVFLRLREDTVDRIAKHDPEFALSFLNSTKFTSDKPLPQHFLQLEQQLEIRLARKAVASNPDVALSLARQTLAQGFSGELLRLLAHLSLKHKEQTQVLYKEVVAKLRKTNLAEDWAARNFAQTLPDFVAPPAIDEAVFRELINVFIKTAQEQGCKQRKSEKDEYDYFCGELVLLIERLQQRALPQPAQRRLTTPDESDDPPEYVRRGFLELDVVAENGAVDEILALVSKYPEIEFEIVTRAMMRAEEDGELDRAQKIATQYTGDPARQKYLLARVEQYKSLAAMNEEQLAEAQRTLNTMPGVKNRLEYLFSLVSRMAPTDRKAALKLLDEATSLVDTLKPGKDQIQAQVYLALMYCSNKSERGFAMMESLLPALNELIGTAAKLDGFDTHYLRDGEWNMSSNGNLGVLLTALAHNAGYFAWCDFDRAVTLTGQFERSEIRMMAQLKLAQGILSGPPKRLVPFHIERPQTYQYWNRN